MAKVKKQKISPKVFAFLVLEAAKNNGFSVFFYPSDKESPDNYLSKTNERTGQQIKNLIDSALVVAKRFAATQNKPDKISLIKRLSHDFRDFNDCHNAIPKYIINTRV